MAWSRKFEKYEAITDVPARVRKTEVFYWCGFLAGVAVVVWGLWMMMQPNRWPVGMFLSVVGLICIAFIKLWAVIRLSTYTIIMEIQLRDSKC